MRAATRLLIGANPVPLATNTIGLSLSSRRKKVPSGPSKRRMSLSFILVKTYSVNAPLAIFRTCSSIWASSSGRIGHRIGAALTVAQDDLDVLPGQELQALVGGQR